MLAVKFVSRFHPVGMETMKMNYILGKTLRLSGNIVANLLVRRKPNYFFSVLSWRCRNRKACIKRKQRTIFRNGLLNLYFTHLAPVWTTQFSESLYYLWAYKDWYTIPCDKGINMHILIHNRQQIRVRGMAVTYISFKYL